MIIIRSEQDGVVLEAEGALDLTERQLLVEAARFLVLAGETVRIEPAPTSPTSPLTDNLESLGVPVPG